MPKSPKPSQSKAVPPPEEARAFQELLITLLTEATHSRIWVRPNTTMQDLVGKDFDDIDFWTAITSYETMTQRIIPDDLAEYPAITVGRFATEVARLPRVKDPLHPWRRCQVLADYIADRFQHKAQGPSSPGDISGDAAEDPEAES